jgi:hypothetical protein|tara:strand:- start:2706 stop:2984 length:279 start_codon:yes stop_codon:yes gene_type:complete
MWGADAVTHSVSNELVILEGVDAVAAMVYQTVANRMTAVESALILQTLNLLMHLAVGAMGWPNLEPHMILAASVEAIIIIPPRVTSTYLPTK